MISLAKQNAHETNYTIMYVYTSLFISLKLQKRNSNRFDSTMTVPMCVSCNSVEDRLVFYMPAS